LRFQSTCAFRAQPAGAVSVSAVWAGAVRLVRSFLLIGSILPVGLAFAGSDATPRAPIEFTADRWDLSGATVTEHLGRTSLAGAAVLRDTLFRDGVIEVDLTVTGGPGYPGLLFRMQSDDDYERVYLRPHRAGRYPDAIHYAPSFHGVTGWQLYFGEGYTAEVRLPPGEWIRLRLEFSGSQARLFVGNAPKPALTMDHLARDPAAGGLGLLCSPDGSSYFSNFRCHRDSSLAFGPPRPADIPPGMIRNWELSTAFKLSRVDRRKPYEEQDLGVIAWTPIEAEPNGRIDFCRWVARPQGEQSTADLLFARTSVRSEKAEVRPLLFGYSDAVSLFLNGRLLFAGRSAYRQRDPSFLGIMGLFDEVALPLRKGENELVACVAESFGGWGLICQDGSATVQATGLRSVAESSREFLSPESAAWDPRRRVFYVSNFDPGDESVADGGSFLARVDPDGRVLDARWIGGMANPTGLAVRGDSLYVVERTGMAVVDLTSGHVARRVSIPTGRFLNDIAMDGAGTAYITDSGAATIHRVTGGQAEAWLIDPRLAQANGICTSGDSLLVGCTADARVRSIQIATLALRTVATLPSGTMDGLAVDGRGGILLSQVEGRIYRIATGGHPEKILDVTTRGVGCADFGYAPESGTLVVPTFQDNRVVTYRLDGERP
jgi:sugar lactone lactonase YvrE